MKRNKPSRSPKYREYREPLKDHDDADTRPPSKKQRSSIRVDREQNMELSNFQTPHPTLESQSQTFKLPSSSPQPSPRGLSPVPGVFKLPEVAATSSKNFKENAVRLKRETSAMDPPAASSTPWNRHTSKPFASMMRMANSRKSRPRTGRYPSRSHSRSSSNNSHSNVSSRANSRERPKAPITKPHNPLAPKTQLKPESSLKHAYSLSSLDANQKDQLPGISKLKPNSKKSSKSKQGPRPLASPFVSRASSPVQLDCNAHIPTQTQTPLNAQDEDPPKNRIIHHYGRKSSMRSVLGDVTLDPNLPATAKDARVPPLNYTGPSREWHRNVLHSFEKPKTPYQTTKKIDLVETTARKRKKATAKVKPSEQLLYAAQNKLQVQAQAQEIERERERRPSAPSSLHLPKQVLPASIPADAKPPSGSGSGVHVFLDKLRQGIASVNPESASAVPPTPRLELKDLKDPANAKQSSRKTQPSRQLHLSASMSDLHSGSAHHVATAGVGKLEVDNDDKRTAWMHTRSNVDFDRPPSQMEVGPRGGVGVGFGFEDAEETFFTSSEDEGSAEEEDEGAYERERRERRLVDMSCSPRELTLRSSCADEFWLHDENFDLERDLDLKVQGGFGFGFGRLGRAFGDGDDDERQGGEWMPGFDPEKDRFGEDALVVSTPAKDFLAGLDGLKDEDKGGKGRSKTARRVSSLPTLRKGVLEKKAVQVEAGPGALARSASYSGSRGTQKHEDQNRHADEDEDGEEDMDLTGSAAAGRTHRDEEREHNNGANANQTTRKSMYSWITDSLISPPTAYLGRKGFGRAKAMDQEQTEECSIFKDQESSSSTLDGPSYNDQSHAEMGQGASGADFGVAGLLPAYGEHDLDLDSSSSGRSDKTTTATASGATRTRSGTIVPANPKGAAGAAIPPGSRRTRSGTIVGPLPPAPPPAFALPARPDGSSANAVGTNIPMALGHPRVGAAPIRTRSGTIVASASVPRPAEAGARGRIRSGSVVKVRPAPGSRSGSAHARAAQMDGGVDKVGAQDAFDEADDVVQCYTDSLYMPAQAQGAACSSPDPIDLLRFASIAEAEEEDEEDNAWRVVREPPSPETRRKRDASKPRRGRSAGALRGLKWLARGGKGAAKAGGKRGLKARFVDGGEEEEDEDVLGDAEDSSDDELLLVPGASGAKF